MSSVNGEGSGALGRRRIRVMIVDDQPVVRSGLSAFLLAFDDLENVGERRSWLVCP
jgi:hypothetical protein